MMALFLLGVSICLWLFMWWAIEEVLKPRGVASSSMISLLLGLLTTFTIFRTAAVIVNSDLHTTKYDALLWLACFGGWAYVWRVYKRDKVAADSVLNKSPNDVKKFKNSNGLIFGMVALVVVVVVCNKKSENSVPSVSLQNAPNTVASPFSPQIKDENYKSLDVTAERFANRFNDVILKVDKNWAIKDVNHRSKKDGAKYYGLKFTPTSSVSIGGTVNDDGTIRELALGIAGGKDETDNVRSVATMLAASIAINNETPKEQVSKIVTSLFKDAMSHPRKASEATIGKYDYTVNYSPEMGGMMFVISDNHAGID